MRQVTRRLPVLLAVLLVTGCAAKSTPSAPGTVAADSPGYTGPPVVTESAMPTDSTGGTATDPSGTASPSATQTSVPPSTPAPVRTVSPGAGLAECALPYLRISVRPAAVRSAHASYLLTFTNTGQVACRMAGYPSVVVLNSAGRPVLRATPTPSGYLGGVHGRPTTVLVGSDQPASALLEGEQIDLSGNRCPARPGLQITPPSSAVPARIPVTTTICGGVQIHPVVPGGTGSSG
ncbi:MAG TPA: DUF4232 domain-containing protein [Jatrophihabitans sp.]|nr:DUF4232 domain-containing protein [Jatrophihabitans sp.]